MPVRKDFDKIMHTYKPDEWEYKEGWFDCSMCRLFRWTFTYRKEQCCRNCVELHLKGIDW